MKFLSRLGVSILLLIGADAYGQLLEVSEKKANFDEQQLSIIRNFFDIGRAETRTRIRQSFRNSSLSQADIEEIKDLSPIDLKLLISSYRSYVEETQDLESSLFMLRLLSEHYLRTSREDQSTEEHPTEAQRVYDVLINSRFFRLAENLAKKYPNKILAFPFYVDNVEPLPSRYPYYAVDDQISLKAKTLAVDGGEWLIVSMSPGCAFSIKAIEFFEKNAIALEPHLPENIAWVATDKLTYYLPYFEQFNQRYQNIDFLVSADDNRWPDKMALHITPVFYRVYNGEIVDQLSGWAGDNPEVMFLEFLERFSSSATSNVSNSS